MPRSKPSYCEYGCGGSTEMQSQKVSSRRFCRKRLGMDYQLRKKANIAASMKAGILKFKHVDIGPVGAWGVPKNDSKIRNWPEYCLAPYNEDIKFDFVLVDGRFRPACCYVTWAKLVTTR